MTLSAVTGFFYRIGSLDYPANMSPDSKFGFDQAGSTTPVFSYSENDVEKAITNCRSLSKKAIFEASGDSTDVLLASDDTSGTLASEDITGTGWVDAFKIIEFCYNNQATLRTDKHSDSYSNYADEQLASGGNIATNPYYVSNYSKGTLTYESSSHAGRIRYIRFTCGGFSSGSVTFVAYFDADYFVENTNSVYAVYRYEDLDNNDQINSSEFNTQIVTKLFNITKDGKYKSYSIYTARKRVDDTTYVDEDFYVFTTLNKTAIDSDIMKTQVKAYLKNLYDETYLRYHYPDLFSENKIIIAPIYDNTIATISGTNIYVYPVTTEKISSRLTALGFNMASGSQNYRPCEVFYLGPGKGWTAGTSNPYAFPILAIESDYSASGVTQPISKRFPSYKPIYGEAVTGAAAEFHFILLKILAFFKAGKTSIDGNIEDDFKTEYSVSSEIDSTLKICIVQFTFAGNVWYVYGPTSAEAANLA